MMNLFMKITRMYILSKSSDDVSMSLVGPKSDGAHGRSMRKTHPGEKMCGVGGANEST